MNTNSDSIAVNSEAIVEINVPPDFSYPEVLQYLTRSPNECVYRVQGKTVYKLMSIRGELCLVEVRSVPSGLVARVVNRHPITPEMSTEIRNMIQFWFDLNRDLTPFYEMAKSDKLLASIVDRYRGLRLVGVADLFEATAWAIIGQQINLAFAYTLKKRLVEQYGAHLDWMGQRYFMFPSASAIVQIRAEELLPLQFSRRKAEYLIEAARVIHSGQLSREKLIALPDLETVTSDMVKVRGIGPWTANYVAMRCLRDPRAFPIQDVGLHNAIKAQLGLANKPTVEDIKNLARSWRGFEAYATFYLWHSLQGPSA